MRIAVMDDEKNTVDHLIAMLEQHQLVSGTCFFSSIDGLQDALEDGAAFDVIMMDIEWHQEQNGMDFAEQLLQKSPQTQIIYITGYNDRFSQRIFLQPANLCGYLVKPVESQLLDSMLEKAQRTIQTLEADKLVLQQKGVVHSIRYRDICYLESKGHQLIVHTPWNSELFYERLEDLKTRLPRQFYQCHKSYLVNMNQVRRLERGHLLLATGEEVPVSKARYAATRTAYFRYLGESL